MTVRGPEIYRSSMAIEDLIDQADARSPGSLIITRPFDQLFRRGSLARNAR
jgi:hypothetical protein